MADDGAYIIDNLCPCGHNSHGFQPDHAKAKLMQCKDGSKTVIFCVQDAFDTAEPCSFTAFRVNRLNVKCAVCNVK